MSRDDDGSESGSDISMIANADSGSQITQIAHYEDYRHFSTVTELRIDAPDPNGMLPLWSVQPGELIDLFGRDRELEALTALFDPGRGGGRTVVLTGSRHLNGLGRTALAWYYADAALQAGAYPGGAHYLSLLDPVAPESRVDPVRALPALLTLSGVPSSEIPALASQQWARYREFQNRPPAPADGPGAEAKMLLILDDVSDSAQIAALHPHGGHHLLVIPRAPLDQPAGREIVLDPLDASASAALLKRSAGDGQEALFADADDRSKIERLTWIASGLPKVLDLLGRYLAHDRDRNLADLARGLAAAVDALPENAPGVGRELNSAALAIGEPTQSIGQVGQRAAAQWITDDWQAGRAGRWEIEGRSGSGKSTLFTNLAQHMRDHSGAVILLSANTLAEKTRSGASAAAEEAAREALDAGEESAKTQGASAGASGVPAASDAGERYRSPDMLVFCRAVLNAIAEDLSESVPGLAQDLENFAVRAETPEAMRDLAVDALRAAFARGERKFAFFVDNADSLGDDPRRGWLMDLATSIGCPVAVTLQADARSAVQAATRLSLLPLTSTQVRRLAVSSTGRPLLDEQQAARLVEVTQGSLVYVAGALEPIRDDPTSVDEILEIYGQARLETGIEAAHIRNIRRRFNSLSQKWLKRPEADVNLFDYMALLRSFDQPTLVEVLANSGGTDDREAVERLVEDLFGGSAFLVDEDSADGVRRMHELAASRGRRSLAKNNPALHQRLHKNISRALFGLMEDWDPGEAHMQQEASWVKFETPVWTSMAGEWFYHVAMSSKDKDRIDKNVRVEMSLLYFRALWWYGWFAPSPLCDQVPFEALELTKERTSTGDREWARALDQVQKGYPHTWRKAEAPAANWQLCADGLLLILRRTPQAAAGDDGRAVAELRMYINAFLADCARYKPGSTPRSQQEYLAEARRHAEHAFEGLEDMEWNFPWFEMFDAEAALDRQDPDGAEEAMARITEYDTDSIDTDLRCRFMISAARMAGDRGDPEFAVRLAANAVMRTYIYHIEQETTDQAPSHYTKNLHEEALAGFEAALGAVRPDPEAWSRAVEWTVDYFAPYWRDSAAPDEGDDEDEDGAPLVVPVAPDAEAVAAMSAAGLIATYVPPPPTTKDFIRTDGVYADRASRVRNRVDDELEFPPLTAWCREVPAAESVAEETVTVAVAEDLVAVTVQPEALVETPAAVAAVAEQPPTVPQPRAAEAKQPEAAPRQPPTQQPPAQRQPSTGRLRRLFRFANRQK